MSGSVSTRLYLVRHCDVQNAHGVLYGHLSGFPLSQRGHRQAHALGRYFATTSVRRIYTSPLERARQTAEIIASYVRDVDIVDTDDLIEAYFGRYLQGVRPRDIPWRRPLWFVHMLWPGVLHNDETVGAMAARVERPLTRLLDEFPGEGGICVSHGDPIQAFWVRADHRPAHALHRLQCAKGGRLELDYSDHELTGLAYCPPSTTGAPEAPRPQPDASHA